MITSSPGIERRHQRVEEHLLAAGADDDLRRLVVEAVLALELARDRGLQLGDAVDRGVLAVLPLADRLDRGFLDVVGRVEVGLAGAEPDDVAAGGFQRARLVGHRDGGGRLDACERVGEEGHGNLRCLWSSGIRAELPTGLGWRTASLKPVMGSSL